MTQQSDILENLMGDVLRVLPTLQGWCSAEKAKCLVRTILTNKPTLIVELGIFGGSSFIPMLMALRQNKQGRGAAIDPWTTAAALENMQSPENKDWWGKLDIESIYKGFVQQLDILGLRQYCDIMRNKSEDVVGQFKDESIDLLHIDGNHSEQQSYGDVVLWLPKVKKNAVVFFDDIWWTDGTDDVTTRRAVVFLQEHCERVELVGDCMILRKK